MKLSWDEAKRLATLEERGLDFADAEELFVEGTITLRIFAMIMVNSDIFQLDTFAKD